MCCASPASFFPKLSFVSTPTPFFIHSRLTPPYFQVAHFLNIHTYVPVLTGGISIASLPIHWHVLHSMSHYFCTFLSSCLLFTPAHFFSFFSFFFLILVHCDSEASPYRDEFRSSSRLLSLSFIPPNHFPCTFLAYFLSFLSSTVPSLASTLFLFIIHQYSL